MDSTDSEFYRLAAEELKNNPNQGLLIKCGVKSSGDDKQARIMYIETRVKDMKKDIAQKIKLKKQEAIFKKEQVAKEFEKRKELLKKIEERGKERELEKIAEEELEKKRELEKKLKMEIEKNGSIWIKTVYFCVSWRWLWSLLILIILSFTGALWVNGTVRIGWLAFVFCGLMSISHGDQLIKSRFSLWFIFLFHLTITALIIAKYLLHTS